MISSYALRIVTLDRTFWFTSTTIRDYTSAWNCKKRCSNEIGVISSKTNKNEEGKKSRPRAHAVRDTHTFTRCINGTQINPYGSIYSVNGRCNGSSGQHAKPYSIARRNCPVTASVAACPSSRYMYTNTMSPVYSRSHASVMTNRADILVKVTRYERHEYM